MLLSITAVMHGGYIEEFSGEAPPPCEVMRSAEDNEDQCLPGILASPLVSGKVDEPIIEDEYITGE